MATSAASTADAQAWPPMARTLVGSEFDQAAKPGDTIAGIAARYGVEGRVLAAANGLKPRAKLVPGQAVHIDNRHLVPADLDDGILINLPQRFLFLFRTGRLASYYPIAAGKPSWPTPTGAFAVIQLREKPTWYVPQSIQDEMARAGKVVKTRVPPGPNNPLGDHFIGLSMAGYGIHGTTAPLTIFDFKSHGCIRLHKADAASLFEQLSVGQPGEIVYEPVILGRIVDGRIFLEVHKDVYKKGVRPLEVVKKIAASDALADSIDWDKAQAVLNRSDGLARNVTRAPGGA